MRGKGITRDERPTMSPLSHLCLVLSVLQSRPLSSASAVTRSLRSSFRSEPKVGGREAPTRGVASGRPDEPT